ncbi:MAG: type II toxin-antitoxin system HicB family antitoxin [Eubacteriales bacterium]
MFNVYPAVFHKEDDSFWVEFPGLEGCQTFGSTIEETIESAQEALGLYLVSIIEDGIAIPTPSAIDEIQLEENCFVNLIGTDIDKYRKNTKAVKKTLSIPAWLAEEAESQKISLSKVLQDGLKRELGV